MKGKKKCEKLKSIREIIAQKNGINYTPTKCNHEGECAGVCPTCEKEEEFILSEIKHRQNLGLSVDLNVELSLNNNSEKISSMNSNEETDSEKNESLALKQMIQEPFEFEYTGDIAADSFSDIVLPPPPEEINLIFPGPDFEDWETTQNTSATDNNDESATDKSDGPSTSDDEWI